MTAPTDNTKVNANLADIQPDSASSIILFKPLTITIPYQLYTLQLELLNLLLISHRDLRIEHMD
jgi:hypothetical protein